MNSRGCKYFIANTMAHLAGGIGIAAVSAKNPIMLDGLVRITGVEWGASLALFALSLVLLFGIYAVPSGSPLKYGLGALFVITMGQLVSKRVERLEEENILFRVLVLTTGLFAGMMAVGFFDSQNLLGFGPYLFGGLIGLILANLILGILAATKTVGVEGAFKGNKLLSVLGTALFSVYVAYDTQVLKNHARLCRGRPDYIGESLGLFLDFVNLFGNMANLSE
jgi:FtsH-binding integral membrane protein